MIIVFAFDYGGDVRIGMSYYNTNQDYYDVTSADDRVYAETDFTIFMSRNQYSFDFNAGILRDDFYYEKNGNLGISFNNDKFGNLRAGYSYTSSEDLSFDNYDYDDNRWSLEFSKYFNDDFFIGLNNSFYDLNYSNNNSSIQDYHLYNIQLFADYRILNLNTSAEIINYTEGTISDSNSYFCNLSVDIYEKILIVNNGTGFEQTVYENENSDYYNYSILRNNFRIGRELSRTFTPFLIFNLDYHNAESYDKDYYDWELGLELNILENPILVELFYGQLKYKNDGIENLNYERYLMNLAYNYWHDRFYFNIANSFQLKYYEDLKETFQDESLNSGYLANFNFEFNYLITKQIDLGLDSFYEYNNNYLSEKKEDVSENYSQFKVKAGVGYNILYKYNLDIYYEYVFTDYTVDNSYLIENGLIASLGVSF